MPQNRNVVSIETDRCNEAFKQGAPKIELPKHTNAPDCFLAKITYRIHFTIPRNARKNKPLRPLGSDHEGRR